MWLVASELNTQRSGKCKLIESHLKLLIRMSASTISGDFEKRSCQNFVRFGKKMSMQFAFQ